MSDTFHRLTLLLFVLALFQLALHPAHPRSFTIRRVGLGAPAGTIEVRGVAAGAFNPKWWQAGTLNWNYDARAPILPPREGPLRNIYAPTLIYERTGYRIYYGGWDGCETGNDRIYTVWTKDFLDFTDRHLVIDHGVFIHVNNCSALKLPRGGYRMMCTAYPDKNDRNKPAAFTSPDGLTWNSVVPYSPTFDDLIAMEGYEPFVNAEINGVNVILFEDGKYRLYFNDWLNFGHVYRASSTDFKHFKLDGPALAAEHAVNDVKRFQVGRQRWYLMALHRNTDHLWYSLSRDGQHFGSEQVLTPNQNNADRYIVAVGLVTDGKVVFGVFYGAGAVPSLDQNRIFAKWLQKRVVFRTAQGAWGEGALAYGPDRVRIPAAEGTSARGRFEVYAEDGKTLLYTSPEVTMRAGEVWQLRAADR